MNCCHLKQFVIYVLDKLKGILYLHANSSSCNRNGNTGLNDYFNYSQIEND